jgi:hypothetical protein
MNNLAPVFKLYDLIAIDPSTMEPVVVVEIAFEPTAVVEPDVV